MNSEGSILVSKREAARLLGISERTLHTWMKRGIVPAVKVGRRVLFSVESLRAWVARQCKPLTGD